ncbi:MAG TPA: thiamine phosphate synthase [Sedimenticola thiotaurini]|uniref:Thiamine-phosphate synthase n=1 Tax=Sedimenticola thiotaurini TaxID=1543721 RepID=A0A831RMX9_9GAMM|nr:thiamine phosphate synthase [Sedimenticola thiotaurini]
MTHHFDLRGLYAITDPGLAAGDLAGRVESALLGGARAIQYRDKGDDGERRRHEARTLQALCRRFRVPLIVNDDLELARLIGADGVHLGRDDPDPARARALLGPDAVIGVSCYDRLELARAAAAAGADYVAFGRFFPSRSKPEAVPATADLLHRARDELSLPLVAIGGITPENGGPLVAAGASMLAVIHGVFGQPDVRAACQRFQPLFAQRGQTT